jgi:hypothetical protein
MDPRSEVNLVGVRPKLADVIRATPQTHPFEVTYGLRMLTEEAEAVATHHSKTMHSRHLATAANPLCAAIDFTPLVGGKLSFCAGHEAEFYGAVWDEILATSDKLSIRVQWGGNWAGPRKGWDWGHVQLPWLTDP